MRLLAVLLPLLALSSCGYSPGTGEILQDYHTISVPYVVGDVDGSLTSEIIHQLAAYTPLRYISCGGNLTLKVKLTDSRNEPIGFQYETNSAGQIVSAVVSCEDRTSLLAEVQLIDGASGCVVLGPAYITASVEYDYDPDSSNQNLARFSLGQFIYRNSAREEATVPLYHNLAVKIANYINAAW